MGDFDKSDFTLISEVNGFEIREHPINGKYFVFLPNFEGSFITDFSWLITAVEFCSSEDADEWEKTMLGFKA